MTIEETLAIMSALRRSEGASDLALYSTSKVARLVAERLVFEAYIRRLYHEAGVPSGRVEETVATLRKLARAGEAVP